MTKKKTKRILRIIFIMASIGSLYFVPWILVKAWILPLPDTVQEQLDEAISHGFDGMIVYIDQTGKPPMYYAAGWHNRESKIPAKPNALFKIASISKLYTAVSITKLAKDKHLSLDEMLAEIAIHYDSELEYAMKKLSDAIGPLLTIGLAAVVGFFALAIFLPMWDLTKMVQ